MFCIINRIIKYNNAEIIQQGDVRTALNTCVLDIFQKNVIFLFTFSLYKN